MAYEKFERNNDVFSLKDIVNQIVKENNLSYGLDKVQVKKIWEKMVGPAIFRYTDKVVLQGKTLFIKLNSAPLRENLNSGKSKLVEQMNNELGAEVIEHIIFQ